MKSKMKKPNKEEIKEIALNQSQIDLFNQIIPGFSTLQEGTNVKEFFEKIIPGFNDPYAFQDKLKSKASELEGRGYRSSAAFGVIYSQISSYYKDVVKQVNKIRGFYLIDVILNQVTEDALAPDTTTGDVLTVKSKNPEIQKRIDRLQEIIDFDDLVCDITPDLLANGQYYLRPDVRAPQKDNKGSIVKQGGMDELLDTVEQSSVVAITKNGQITKYLVQGDNNKLELVGPAEYVKFTLGNQKLRVDLNAEYRDNFKENEDVFKDIPRYIRLGKSFLYPVLAKIKELELLEAMVPAAKLSKLSSGTLVGVNLPAGTDLNKALDAAKRIEGMINKQIGIDSYKNEITLETIMSSAGKMKVVPLLGDKGTLQKLDYQSDEPDDLVRSVKDLREVICTSLGMPYELIFGNSETKGALLKKYARYLRRLKSVQRALADGVREIIYIDLANAGVPFKLDEVEVEFSNKLIEIDNLDKLEFVDTTIGLLKNLDTFVKDLNSEESILKGQVDVEAYKTFLSEQLKSIGLSHLLIGVKSADPGDKPTQPYPPGTVPTKLPPSKLPLPPVSGMQIIKEKP